MADNTGIEIEVTTRVIADKFLAISATFGEKILIAKLTDIERWTARERALEAVSVRSDVPAYRELMVATENAMASEWSRDGEVL